MMLHYLSEPYVEWSAWVHGNDFVQMKKHDLGECACFEDDGK